MKCSNTIIPEYACCLFAQCGSRVVVPSAYLNITGMVFGHRSGFGVPGKGGVTQDLIRRPRPRRLPRIPNPKRIFYHELFLD